MNLIHFVCSLSNKDAFHSIILLECYLQNYKRLESFCGENAKRLLGPKRVDIFQLLLTLYETFEQVGNGQREVDDLCSPHRQRQNKWMK